MKEMIQEKEEAKSIFNTGRMRCLASVVALDLIGRDGKGIQLAWWTVLASSSGSEGLELRSGSIGTQLCCPAFYNGWE